MMIRTNLKLLYNRRKLLLLAAKGRCIFTPFTRLKSATMMGEGVVGQVGDLNRQITPIGRDLPSHDYCC